MLSKTVPTNEESPDGTRYNYPPVNLKELTEVEFARSGFAGGRISYIEFRQMLLNSDLSVGIVGGKLVQAKLFWFDDDTGIAISTDHYSGKVRFFSFGCHHSFDEKTFQAGQSYQCKNCNTKIHESWMDLLVSDSGWNVNELTSRRTITDYERFIKFNRQLDDSEKNRMVKFIKRTDCPGWTDVGVGYRGDGVYHLVVTYDSSD